MSTADNRLRVHANYTGPEGPKSWMDVQRLAGQLGYRAEVNFDALQRANSRARTQERPQDEDPAVKAAILKHLAEGLAYYSDAASMNRRIAIGAVYMDKAEKKDKGRFGFFPRATSETSAEESIKIVAEQHRLLEVCEFVGAFIHEVAIQMYSQETLHQAANIPLTGEDRLSPEIIAAQSASMLAQVSSDHAIERLKEQIEGIMGAPVDSDAFFAAYRHALGLTDSPDDFNEEARLQLFFPPPEPPAAKSRRPKGDPNGGPA